MRTTNHFIVMLLCALLHAPTALAQQVQDKQHDAQTDNAILQDVMVIVQQENVRFTAQKAIAEMQLKVFDRSSELIYDSGATPEPELNWPLRNADGKAVKSGLYAYQLSIKEAGAETARLRRGHFIVDRAKEREGQTDWLWITSQQDSGVGTELMVAAATSGTTGRIAKFISATDLGDSVMTELNGNVGIGTSSPGTRLAVQTATSSYGIVHTDGDAVLSTFVGAGTSATTNGGWLGTVSNHDLRFFTANGPARMTIGTTGNVGIGTNSPGTRLAVQTATSSYGISHTDGEAVLATFVGTGASTTTKGGWLGTVSNHDLRFFTANGPARMTIGTTGNVGIGTLTPQANLDVAGMTRTSVLQIMGGSDLAEPFVITAAEFIKPGTVVGIDPQRPGRLQVTGKAYDRAVAGIVSGANGINPGLTMKQEGTATDGSLLVALTGRVYCWVDASYGPIEPGDLLTTSDTPGHAMKVTDHAKAQGAIIGKAMTELKQGKGLVLVLVTLQ